MTRRGMPSGARKTSGRPELPALANLEVVSKCAVGCGPNLVRSARVRPAGCCRANQVRVFRLLDALETREPGSGLGMKGPAFGSRTRSVSIDREVCCGRDAGADAGGVVG